MALTRTEKSKREFGWYWVLTAPGWEWIAAKWTWCGQPENPAWIVDNDWRDDNYMHSIDERRILPPDARPADTPAPAPTLTDGGMAVVWRGALNLIHHFASQMTCADDYNWPLRERIWQLSVPPGQYKKEWDEGAHARELRQRMAASLNNPVPPPLVGPLFNVALEKLSPVYFTWDGYFQGAVDWRTLRLKIEERLAMKPGYKVRATIAPFAQTGERRQGDGTAGAESDIEQDRRTATAPWTRPPLTPPLTREQVRDALTLARDAYSRADAREMAHQQIRLTESMPDGDPWKTDAGRRRNKVDVRYVEILRSQCSISEPLVEEFMRLLSPEPLPRLWTREGQREQQEELRRQDHEEWLRQQRVRDNTFPGMDD